MKNCNMKMSNPKLKRNIKGLKIKGTNGFEKFSGVAKTRHKCYLKITFSDGGTLECSGEHVFQENDVLLQANDLETGMSLNGRSIFFIEKIDEEKDLYDVVNTESHTYVSSGVISHNCQFLSQKGTLINTQVLEALKEEEPVLYPDEGLSLWVRDMKGRTVAISCDVGEGVGQDYHAIHISDVETFEQIGEFHNNTMTQTEYTKTIIKILDLCWRLGAVEVYYTVENNSIGLGIISLLQNSESPALDSSTFISHHDSSKLGMPMNRSTKPLGCQKVKDLIELDRYKIRSKRLINELKFFVQSGNSFSAESGKHDDLCMAFVLMALLLNELADYEESAYDKMSEIQYDEEADSYEVGIF